MAPQTPLDLREVQLARLGFSKPCVGQSEQFLKKDAATVAHQVAPHGNVAVLRRIVATVVVTVWISFIFSKESWSPYHKVREGIIVTFS